MHHHLLCSIEILKQCESIRLFVVAVCWRCCVSIDKVYISELNLQWKGGGGHFIDDDGDFYSVTLAFRQTADNKADGGQ